MLRQIEDQRLTSTAIGDAMQAQVQAIAAALGITLRPPPPWPTTCCGRGCATCVWEGYYNALDWWREDALDAVRATGVGLGRDESTP